MKDDEQRRSIKSYRDLVVYQRLYSAMIVVLKDVIYTLPKEEKYDLVDQMRRCCKASPSLLAEGFAKRYQPKAWKKYIEDAIGENNEMIHHLSVCIDVYPDYVPVGICDHLIEEYDIANKQCHALKEAWIDYHKCD